MADKENMSIKEAAEYLSLSPSYLRRKVRRKEIPHNRHGSRYVFHKPMIDQWLRETTIYDGHGGDPSQFVKTKVAEVHEKIHGFRKRDGGSQKER